METWGSPDLLLGWSEVAHILGAAQIELTRAAAAGKPFWITELQGGHGSDGYIAAGRCGRRIFVCGTGCWSPWVARALSTGVI